MRILLTSGGTKTPIDEVRHVGNMSGGTFGSKLCVELLKLNHQVTFLYSRGSKCPHEFRANLSGAMDASRWEGMLTDMKRQITKKLEMSIDFLGHHADRYLPVEYTDFDSYDNLLSDHLVRFRPEIVILAAAVSDYRPTKAEGKISSDHANLSINLEQTPKLIRRVRDVLPDTFLVGFKLLVNSTQQELEDAMAKQMDNARTDMVIGNDLRDIKASRHALTILSIDNVFYRMGPLPGDSLAKELVGCIISDSESMDNTMRKQSKEKTQ